MQLWVVPLLIGAVTMMFGGPVVGLLAVIVALMIFPQYLDWHRARRLERDALRLAKAMFRAEMEMRQQQSVPPQPPQPPQYEAPQYKLAVERHYKTLSTKRSVGLAFMYCIALPLGALFLLFG